MNLDRDALFIGGEWAAPASGELLQVISPHSEEVVATVPVGTAADIDAAVAAARTAYDEGPWPRMTPAERIAVVEAFSGLYAGRLGDMADLITTEMGSPTAFSNLAQAPAPWMQIEAFLASAREFPWEAARPGALGADVIVRHEPVGVVAAIAPWNVPQFTIMSKLVPALLAGCTVVVKPAPEAPLDPYLLAELLQEAGVPPGVVNIVAAGREAGAHLVAHPGVDKVAFTGSTAAGRAIGAVCGEQLKRVSLELGGKSAAIVLDDADLAPTMEGLKFIALMNSGQACVAQTRILVSRNNYDTVVDALAETVSAMRVGDPADPETEIGPMVAQRQQERVRSTSPSARRKAPGSSSAEPECPKASTAAGTSGRRYSPTSTTRCGSRRRRSSARFCRSSRTTTSTTPYGSPTTPTTGWPARSGPPTSTPVSTLLAGCAPAPTA